MLIDLLNAAAERAPETVAVITDAGSVTFAALRDRVEHRAADIAARTEPGDRIAVLAENCAEYIELYYAVPYSGRVLVPLNHRLHPAEWRATLAAADARVLLGDRDLIDRIDADLTHVIAFDDPLGSSKAFTPPVRTADDTAWLMGTSGTTGTPKLAILSDANLLAAVDATLPARPVGPTDALLTPFPLCHVAGYNVFVLHRRARPIVLQRSFDPIGLTQLVRDHEVTMLSLAPTMIAMLLDHAEVCDDDLASVRALGYGASPIPGPLLGRIVDRWDWDCSQGFGMTELAGNALFLGADEHRRAAAGDERLLTAAGRPAAGVEIRLGARDELLVRAPQMMRGYWDDAAATAGALADGWLHTGDVARIDADGLVSIVDRLKDVIVSGGENVASREVEDVLHAHPMVRDVAVIGLPDERWGERVCAVVVALEAVDRDELVAHCRARLAGFKIPRRVEFVDVLPRNSTGKVLKHQLRAELAGN